MASASIGFSHHLSAATLISLFVLAMFGAASGADDSLLEVSDMINSQEYGRARFLLLPSSLRKGSIGMEGTHGNGMEEMEGTPFPFFDNVITLLCNYVVMKRSHFNFALFWAVLD